MHRLDPRGKTLLALLFFMLTAVVAKLDALAGLLAVSAILVCLARLPMRAVAGRVVVVNLFVIFMWVMLPFVYSGEKFWHVGPVAVSVEGVQLAVVISLKANAIFLGFLALVSTTRFADLGRSLHFFAVPGKFVQLLLFSFRYVHTLREEYDRLYQAAQVRAFAPTFRWHTYRTYSHLLGMLLVRSFARSQRIYEAMLCRGFDGSFHTLRLFRFSLADRFFFIVIVLLLLGFAVLEWR